MTTVTEAIGFIGLGRMGAGMVANLLKSGVDLLVFDANPQAIAASVANGARGANDIADLAQRSRVIFTSLPGPVEVEAVYLGADGLSEHVTPGTVAFDLSTSSRELALRIAEMFRAKGCEMLDAPVSGGPAGAASGALVLWIGGDRETSDRLSPLISTFGHPHYVGGSGSGTTVKLVHNMLGYTLLEAQAEAFTLGAKAGVDPLDLWEAIRLGVVGRQSPIYMLTQQFLVNKYDEAAFAQRLALKDVRLALAMADELDVPMRLAELTRQDMEAVVARGEGEGDSRSFMQLQVERAGVKISVPTERVARALSAAQGEAPN